MNASHPSHGEGVESLGGGEQPGEKYTYILDAFMESLRSAREGRTPDTISSFLDADGDPFYDKESYDDFSDETAPADDLLTVDKFIKGRERVVRAFVSQCRAEIAGASSAEYEERREKYLTQQMIRNTCLISDKRLLLLAARKAGARQAGFGGDGDDEEAPDATQEAAATQGGSCLVQTESCGRVMTLYEKPARAPVRLNRSQLPGGPAETESKDGETLDTLLQRLAPD